jgi:hypothetical protein
MNRPTKSIAALVALVCLVGVFLAQQRLDVQRRQLLPERSLDLRNAPPMLAFTTVALGGFRGLIANALWMRANTLQDEDKYFEMVQLADWITRLQPRMKQTWIVQAWNMAYNISVKFTEPEDRWRWVLRGIELLRDEGLKYNPDEALMYRELGWFFQHKMGQGLDDAHQYYKKQWFDQMTTVLGNQGTNYVELINPQTEEARARARLLTGKYRMDPRLMQEVDNRFGPLEWRLPEAHAIYWAARGLQKAKPDDQVTLRRMIYQAMQLSFQRGRVIVSRVGGVPLYGPNLFIIPKVNAAYEEMLREDQSVVENMQRAHRNFLRQAVYQLYTHNRMTEANRWFKYLKATYPKDTQVLGANGDLDTFAIRKVTENMEQLDQNQARSFIEGFIRTSYTHLILDDDDRALGFGLLARKVYQNYQAKSAPSADRIGLPPYAELEQAVQRDMLDPEKGLEAQFQAVLRSRLNLPAPKPVVPKP